MQGIAGKSEATDTRAISGIDSMQWKVNRKPLKIFEQECDLIRASLYDGGQQLFIWGKEYSGEIKMFKNHNFKVFFLFNIIKSTCNFFSYVILKVYY